LCRPTSGGIQRFGRPLSDRGTLARIGYVHDLQAFPRYLTAAELLKYYGALTLLPYESVCRRVPILLERVGLADRRREPIARFSKGMIQRLGLAQALLNDPELLVLDEPNEGLDLQGRRLVADLISNQRRRGRTVLLVSHVLPEVEEVCDRVGVLMEGRLIHCGPMSSLLRSPREPGTRRLSDALAALYAGNGT
jgi:ABC-2 type transport system ATP-binding protein